MTPDSAKAAAELLLKARADHRKLDRLPEDITPHSIADANLIQDALSELWGLEVVGWKIGASTMQAMEMLGCDAPFPGRVFAPYLLETPAEVAASSVHKCAVEGEMAFRLAADLPPQDAQYRRADVETAVDAAMPAIELINDYWIDGLALGVEHLVADNGSNGGLILGNPIDDWRSQDLAEHYVTMAIDGEVKGEGRGKVVLGHPLNTLVWLANDLSARGIGLKAGQIITTGTITGLTFCQAGETAVADHGDFGKITVNFV
jgi:2-keto-4-pentenoate hydratase